MLARRFLMSGAVLLAFSTFASARDCTGTFIRRSCMMGAAEGMCAYPREKGQEEEFMGWEIQDGVKGYAVYRLGAFAAKDVVLKPGCRLKRYN